MRAAAEEDLSRGLEFSLAVDGEGPCTWVCIGCGRLSDPPAESPYRGRAATHPPPCLYCREVAHVDLRPAIVAQELRGQLARGRLSRIGSRLERWLRRVAALLFVAVSLVLLTFFLLVVLVPEAESLLGNVLLIVVPLQLLVLPLVCVAVGTFFRVWRATMMPLEPARWRLALSGAVSGAPSGAVTGTASGAVTGPARGAGAGPVGLIAPISGRSCLAFEVGLREDAQADAPLGSWLLVEQRNAPLLVGDRIVARDTARLELERRTVAWPRSDEEQARAAGYLRARGFGGDEAAALWMFESVIEVGEVVTLCETTPRSLLRSRGSPGGAGEDAEGAAIRVD